MRVHSCSFVAAARWPRMGTVEVKFGKPIEPMGESFAELATKVERSVRSLAADN